MNAPVADALTDWLAAIEPRWASVLDGGASDRRPFDPDLPIARLTAALALEPPIVALIELLTAAELHESIARRVAEHAGGVPGLPFDLARRLIPDLTPPMLAAMSPVRRFEIIVADDAPRALSRLRLSEAVFDRLCGTAAFDPFLDPALRPIAAKPDPVPALDHALTLRGRDGLSPIVALPAQTPEEAAAGLIALGLKPVRLDLAALPDTPEGRARWGRLWARDAVLDGAALIIAAPDEPMATAALAAIVDPLLGHVVMTGGTPTGAFTRSVRTLGGTKSDPTVRWRQALGGRVVARLGPTIAAASRRFRLDGPTLDALAAELGPALVTQPADQAARLLWHAAARAVPAGRVPGVRMIEPAVGWGDIVLPAALAATLRRIETHVRHADQVMIDWGFGEIGGGRGTGVAALFSGPSGTGKTMAAETLAASVDLRVMLIDISQITSKYIGETSKNIAAAFAEAERTGAVMVWNEGDAIWGSRGTVGSATDRHVNAEIGDLLQRIEAFTGFTIVTTNIKSAIDPAFLRRFRFVADFPLPGAAEREAIWRRMFPPAAPLSVVDDEWRLLASVPLSGGAIRNAALGAAFAAAAAGEPIRLPLIAEEIAAELRKTGQPMPVLLPPRAAA
jgi:hypothetical protein